MKFVAMVRAQCAKLNTYYGAPIRAKYAALNKEQQRLTKLIVIFISLWLFYCVIHHAYLWIFGHRSPNPTPMVIRHGKQIEIPADSPLRAQIELKTVSLSVSPHILSVPGWVEAMPKSSLSVFPPLEGRLVSMPVNVADEVRVGQILMVMRSADFASAYSDYQKALSAYSLAEATLKRAISVNQAGGNSLQVVQQAKDNLLQTESELKRTKAYFKAFSQQVSVANDVLQNEKNKDIFHAAMISLDDPRQGLITLRSTMHGRVTNIYYAPGSFIHELDHPVMDVVGLDKVWITANIPETTIANVHKGLAAKVRLIAYPKKQYAGNIAFVHPIIDSETHRNPTRIVLSNPDNLMQPNMYASVDIYVKEPPQILIPLSAVLMNNESTVVYVESSPWVCQRREIELGTEDGEYVRVISGLKPGERIVTCGGVFINDK